MATARDAHPDRGTSTRDVGAGYHLCRHRHRPRTDSNAAVLGAVTYVALLILSVGYPLILAVIPLAALLEVIMVEMIEPAVRSWSGAAGNG